MFLPSSGQLKQIEPTTRTLIHLDILMSLVVPNHLNQIELELKRQTKMRGVYSLTIFVALVLFIIFGFETASDANSGGFLLGFSQLLDFPIDIIGKSGYRPDTGAVQHNRAPMKVRFSKK